MQRTQSNSFPCFRRFRLAPQSHRSRRFCGALERTVFLASRNKRLHIRCPVSGGGGGVTSGAADQSGAAHGGALPHATATPPTSTPTHHRHTAAAADSLAARTFLIFPGARTQEGNTAAAAAATRSRRAGETRPLGPAHDTFHGHVKVIFDKFMSSSKRLLFNPLMFFPPNLVEIEALLEVKGIGGGVHVEA